MRVEAPKRLSSFVLVSSDSETNATSPAQFTPVMAPKKIEPIKINVANSMVEALLEVATNLFIDMIRNKDKFNGIGLFLKVPPGFREHQAYFETYLLTNIIDRISNAISKDAELICEPRILTNLGRLCQHLSEAIFEGWFLNGAEVLIDLSGMILEILQRPEISIRKSVRLCSNAIASIRRCLLRVIQHLPSPIVFSKPGQSLTAKHITNIPTSI